MTEGMASSTELVLDLSLPKSTDQEMLESSTSFDESLMNSDEPQDLSVTRSADGQIMFKNNDNFQQSLLTNKKAVPLNSATTLKRRGPVIDPYIPPSPQPKLSRKMPPPLTNTGASPHSWNMAVRCLAQTTASPAQHVMTASPLAPQKPPPHQASQGFPIGAFQVNKMRHLSPNATSIQAPARFHAPNSVAQFTRFAPVSACQTIPANINPYNIAGVTPLIHRPTVAKPPTNPANVGILKAPAQRILLPGQRAPTTLIANQIQPGAQKPTTFSNYAISSNQAMAQGSSQGQHNMANASQSAEEMPRHNNPFMAPVGRQETVKQTRVAFRNSPEFSLVHVQHSGPVKQNNNLPHIMPKQAKLTHVPVKAPPNQSIAMPQQALGDLVQTPRGSIQRQPFVNNTIQRPPLQIMRPARQVFPVSVNQSVSMFQKATQQTSTPHVYPQNQLNLLAYKKPPHFAGNPNVQVVATPVAQIMPPQLSRASPLPSQNHLMPRGPPSASNPAFRGLPTPQFASQQVKESVSTMSQNRFLNPPNGVRPLVSSKPLPTSQNIVQQQKIVASLAASLTSSSVLTAGPRFLNPQPTTHNQQLANKYSINSSANNVGLTTAATPSKSSPSSQMGGTPTCSTTMSSAPRVLNPSFSPATAAVVPPPPLVKAEEIAQPNVPSPQPFPNVPINPQPLATLSTPSQALQPYTCTHTLVPASPTVSSNLNNNYNGKDNFKISFTANAVASSSSSSSVASSMTTSQQNYCATVAAVEKSLARKRQQLGLESLNNNKLKSENPQPQQPSLVPQPELKPSPLTSCCLPMDLLDAKVVSYVKDVESGGGRAEFKWISSVDVVQQGAASQLAAPESCFVFLDKCKDDDLPQNMVIEVPSNEDKGTWWVATILYSCRQHIRIRYAGFTDARFDVWIDLQTTDVHPIGWCKNTGHRLEPPEHFPLKVLDGETKHEARAAVTSSSGDLHNGGTAIDADVTAESATAGIKQEPNSSTSVDLLTQKSREFLRNFVVNKYSVHEAFLEQRLFWPIEMRIPVDARMEYEYEPRKIWLVRVINNYSGLLHLRYEGIPDNVTKHDLLSIYTSSKLHGVGYAIKSVNMLMDPPKFMWNYCSNQTEMVKFYQRGWAKNDKMRVRMPRVFFEPVNEIAKSINNDLVGVNNAPDYDFRITSLKGCLNTKLEVVFSKFPHLICVATVTEVLDDETFRVTLDDCNKNGSKHSQVFNLSSFGLFPALWCSKKNVHLTPPLNLRYSKHTTTEFDWHHYLMDNATRCFPDYLLKPPKLKCKSAFQVGYKLEAVNPFHPNQMNPCTVKRVIDDRVLLLEIDGWFSSTGAPVTFFADALGDSIFPARWCESVGFPIFLPWEIPAENRTILDLDLHCAMNQETAVIEENNVDHSLSHVEERVEKVFGDFKPWASQKADSKAIEIESKIEYPNHVKLFKTAPSESELKLHWSNFNHPFWCSKVYVNYGCCKSSLISRYKLSCLRQHFGPGLSIYVIRAMLNALINCSFKPQQVFTQVYSACSHFESTGSSPAYIKAKCRNKNLRALVKLPEKLAEMRDLLMCVLKKLGCCPDLFSFKYYHAKVCDSVDCVSLQNKSSHHDLISEYRQPGSPNALCASKNKSNCKSKKRKKKKMFFSSQKRNTSHTRCSNDTHKNCGGASVASGGAKKQLIASDKCSSGNRDSGMVSDGSLPNSRPVTPRSESPVDTDLDKFIIVEPKRGFSKLKKGAANGGVAGNPPEREKSKRHKSVFSTVNMIARHELDQEDYLLQAATAAATSHSLIPPPSLTTSAEHQNDCDFELSCAPETTTEVKIENESSVVSTSSCKKPASHLSCSQQQQHKKSLALKKRKKVSTSVAFAAGTATTNSNGASKKSSKLRRKLSLSSSSQDSASVAATISAECSATTTNGASLGDRKQVVQNRLKPPAISAIAAVSAKNQTRLLNTRSAKTLDKSDPLKWSTEDLCLHLNTTECADFLPFIRKQCIDGQSFILLTFTYLTDVCEVKKDLAAKVCYQVAKLKKQYLDDTITINPCPSSYKYPEESSL